MSSLCHCFCLSGSEACYDCVIGPWEFHLKKAAKVEIDKYKSQYPLMNKVYEEKLRNTITSEAYKTIWTHHKDCNCIKLVRLSIEKSVEDFMKRRQRLINKYIVKEIEKVISKHFLILSDQPDAPFTLTGFPDDTCKDCKWDYFEPFPPSNFRAWMIEKILSSIDVPCEQLPLVGSCKCSSAAFISDYLMHQWLDATIEGRYEMLGV